MSMVFKSIEGKKIENACNWTTECIISGYAVTLWEKILQFASKIIHINNPKLPTYLLKKNMILHKFRYRGQFREYYAVPYGPHYIWGATARIIKSLSDIFFALMKP